MLFLCSFLKKVTRIVNLLKLVATSALSVSSEAGKLSANFMPPCHRLNRLNQQLTNLLLFITYICIIYCFTYSLARLGSEKRSSPDRGLPHLQENFDFPAVK